MLTKKPNPSYVLSSNKISEDKFELREIISFLDESHKKIIGMIDEAYEKTIELEKDEFIMQQKIAIMRNSERLRTALNDIHRKVRRSQKANSIPEDSNTVTSQRDIDVQIVGVKKLYPCPSCDCFFTTEFRLWVHKDVNHVGRYCTLDERFKCWICRKEYMDATSFEKHILGEHLENLRRNYQHRREFK